MSFLLISFIFTIINHGSHDFKIKSIAFWNFFSTIKEKAKEKDVKLTATLMERLFRLGTIICYTGDVTDSELHLIHIKHAKEIKNYLLKASETARLKRRTLSTMDIGAHGVDIDHDGIPDL